MSDDDERIQKSTEKAGELRRQKFVADLEFGVDIYKLNNGSWVYDPVRVATYLRPCHLRWIADELDRRNENKELKSDT